MSAPLRLQDVLSHPENGGLRVIVGSVDVLWPDVVIDFAESRLPAKVEGALAVLTVEPPPTSWQQDALIRRVKDRGFNALALPKAESLGSGSRLLAGRLALTVLDVEHPMELAKACWQLMEGRDALTLGYVRKVAQSIEYHADSLPDLLRHLAANVGHGIALIASDGVVLEAGGTLPAEVLTAINFAPWLDMVSLPEGAAASVRVDSPGRAGLRLAIFGKSLGDTQLSSLAVAAEVAMPAVAARILIDEVADVNDAAVASGLLRDFLERNGEPDPELEQRMLDRGWRTSGYHLGFRVIGRTRVDTFQLLRLLRQELTAMAIDSHAVTSGRGVIGWLSFATPLAPPELEQLVAGLRAIHLSLRRTFTVATGIGSVESGRAGLISTIAGAHDAARVAANRSSTGWFVRIDALGLEQLLLSWTENDTFIPAAESLLAPLRLNGSDLLSTLSSYLDNESSIAETATALGIHRNTVAARIARVQDRLGLDLSNPETRLAVHLACRTVRS